MNRKHPLAKCEECPLKDNGTRAVYANGPDKAEYAVVGEAPGRTEAAKGQPFIGPSGKLLDAVLDSVGLSRHEVFATNVVLCRPRDNSEPPPRAIDACRDRLHAELGTLGAAGNGPRGILACGNTAATALLGYNTKITRDRVGAPKVVELTSGKETRVVPTIHPAAILRETDKFRYFETDIHKLVGDHTKWFPPTYQVIDNPQNAINWLSNNTTGGWVAVDIETGVEKDEETYERVSNIPRLLCIGFAQSNSHAVVIERNALAEQEVRDELATFLNTNKCIYQNGKYDVGILYELNVLKATDGQISFDTMLAHYCLDERKDARLHSLDNMAQELLGTPNWKSMTKQYESFDDIPPDILDEYNAYDVCNTKALEEIFRPQIQTNGQIKAHDMMCRISEELIHIERRGIKIDLERLEDIKDELNTKLVVQEQILNRWLRNPRSWQQIMAALWEHFEVETPSTDKQHLTAILEEAQKNKSTQELAYFITELLEHRRLTKLKGTYAVGIEKEIVNGRIYPNITLHRSTTGRTSSVKPNLQNIPRGPFIRSMFIADTQTEK